MIAIDGSVGEGGGQIVRTALALSLVTGEPFRLARIRARRPRPGLRPQHLAAVRAAAEIGRARVDGAELHSTEIVFRPGQVRPGSYAFSIGTAGSAGLVLQTVLPPLLLVSGPSHLAFEGGTHNPMAPPFEFLATAFLPLVSRMGPRVGARLERPGFYPAGGGRFTVDVAPAPALSPLELIERGAVLSTRARALVVRLPEHIGERELDVVEKELGWPRAGMTLDIRREGPSPGNALILEVTSAALTEVFTAIGRRGLPAEEVARKAALEARAYLATAVPVGAHLADQLLVPLALAGGGRFRTLALTAHATTNADVIQRFLPVAIRFSSLGRADHLVEVVAR